ncbi:MAG: phage-like protein [Xanthobacteraceae bacterium]|nr:MAG: phage-like protein [Xanthobacteraceae bacterium]
MTSTSNTIRVVIPLTTAKRNGRLKILPPEDVGMRDGRAQDPHVLHAVGRAWGWR